MSATVKPPMDIARDTAVFAVLMAALVGVHYLLAAAPAAWMIGDAAAFSWPGLAVAAFGGLVGVAALSRLPLPGPWDAGLTVDGKLVWPLATGLGLGAAHAAIQALAALPADAAANTGLHSLYVAWPLAPAVYAGAAVLASIFFFLMLVPPLVWALRATVAKALPFDLVYWLVAVPAALIEPVSQGHIAAAAATGSTGLIGVAALNLLVNLAQVFFLRHAGFVAAVLVRLAYYGIWHLAWPLLQASAWS